MSRTARDINDQPSVWEPDVVVGVPAYPHNLPYFVAETVLFVLYSILTGFTAIIFLRRPKGTRFKQWTMHLCALMYLISTGHFCMSTVSFGLSRRGKSPVEYFPEQIIILITVIAISDVIVTWRAWVLWPCNRWVQVVLGLCVLGDIVGLVLGGVVSLSAGFPGAVASLATNVITTALISWKAWRHHKDIKVHLGAYVRRTRVEKTLLVFIESGLVYALLWQYSS